MKTFLKVFGCVVAACLVLMCVAVFLLNTDTFQNKLIRHATQLLSEKHLLMIFLIVPLFFFLNFYYIIAIMI